jgi:hypothetical protein
LDWPCDAEGVGTIREAGTAISRSSARMLVEADEMSDKDDGTVEAEVLRIVGVVVRWRSRGLRELWASIACDKTLAGGRTTLNRDAKTLCKAPSARTA